MSNLQPEEIQKPPLKNKSNITGSGKQIPSRLVTQITELRILGKSLSEISRTTGVSRPTVRKYCQKKVRGVPQTPIDAIVDEVNKGIMQRTEYNIQTSLEDSLHLVTAYKAIAGSKIANGDIPELITPLHIKQLTEAELLVLRAPQDLNSGRQDIYSQLNERGKMRVEASYTVLGAAGDMGEDTADIAVDSESDDVDSTNTGTKENGA